ncbi:MAG: hypothetical protein PF439_06715 [Helicobacteraceae bacterium]|jgi:hypothetical protein|nr:hypothetical protein [Helicobacteraceae bacterium]
MRLFYYVHTGHRIGLDRFRRAATIIRSLGDVDITLLTSDYRIAQEARDFGIKRSVGIDVVRNIPQIAHFGDKIIFDSDELNPTLHADMVKFFSTFIRVCDDSNGTRLEGELLISPYLEGEGICRGVAVDEKYFVQKPKTIEKSFFFGDDDYEEDLFANLGMFQALEMEMIIGFYYFINYENKLAPAFTKQHEFEEYDEVVQGSKIFVTSSPQAALENLASGGRPIYIQRPDYVRDFIPLFETLNIPIVDGFYPSKLSLFMKGVSSHNYHSLEQSTHKISKFLKESLSL